MTISVCYDHQIFSFQQHGGISRYFVELAGRIGRTEGFSSRVVAPLAVNEYLALDGNVRHLGANIPFSGSSMANRLRRVVNGVLVPLMIPIMRPTIVHETYYSPRPVSWSKRPVVLTVYDMIHERFSAMFPQSDRTTAYKKAAVERADLLICISESTRRDLIELFDVPREKTRVVYLGFTLSEQADGLQTTSQGGRPFLLYVGSRAPYKNFTRLVEAYASSPRLRRDMSLVAFGGGAFTADELGLLAAQGLDADSVRQVSGNDGMLAQLYSSAAIFVYPSLYEGFGIPPLEAMQFNCPVACSNTSSIPEVVGDAGAYFDPLDVDSMRAAIESVVFSEEATATMIRKGHAQLQKFSWDSTASETAKIYRELARS